MRNNESLKRVEFLTKRHGSLLTFWRFTNLIIIIIIIIMLHDCSKSLPTTPRLTAAMRSTSSEETVSEESS